MTNSYTVTFYDENKTTILDTLKDEYGTSIVYSGANPIKPADNTYAYTFECWETAEGEEYDLSGKTITSDLALYAKYRATYIEYDIAEIPTQVVIKKGEEVLTSSDTLHYGDRIEITYTVTTGYNMTEFSVTGATREGETNIYTVTGDLTVIYSEEIQTFTVQWLNYDGTLLETDTVAYGSIPEYNGEIPVRESTDDEYVYTFTGWDPETNEAKENISYIAQFRQDEILYFTITRGMITGYTGTDTEVIIPNSYSIAPDGRIITGDAYDVTSIGEAAFQNNSNITSITIPANVTSIGDDAFEGCTGLTEINYNATNLADLSMFNSVFSKAGQDGAGIVLNIGANVRRIPAYLFKTSIYKPNIVAVNFAENSQCTEIGEHAFYYCTSFSSITIPASIISIGNNAFSLSSNLENVYYEGTIEEWMKISFDGHSANPLNNSTNLYVNGDELVTEVNFDSSYTIKAYVFYGCTSITKVTIGSQVTSIRNWAFRGCRNLENVYYEGTIEEWMKISFDDYSNPLYNGANLYVNGDELVTEVSIDSSSTIKNNVFSGCKSLTKVTIGSQVTNIGEYAFYNCSNLTSITIPANVTNIGSHAFYGCTGLIEINYNATNLADLSFDSSIFYDAGQDGAGIVVNIGANVRRIPAYLFDDSNNITTVNFAENSRCIEVGESAFSGYGYGNIVNVYYGGTIEEWMKISFDDVLANPLNEGNLYVNGDELVTEVSINSSSRIKDYVFQGCASITKVTIGNQVTSIGEWAFSGCSNLTNVYYEGTIEEWMEISFDGSSSNPLTNGANLYVNGDELVTEVSIDSSSTIKDYVFQGCTSITKVIIGSQVTSIGSSAFSGCSGLTSITIPANVTSIGSSAFSGCTGLIEINYNATNLADLSRNSYVFRNAGEDGVGIVVNIGANVTRIPAYLFNPYDSSSSPNIVTVNFAENSQCTEIGEYAFRYCGSLTSITIPANVTSIGSGAFSLTFDLETVIIESNYVYKTATSTTACGNLLRYATVVRVLTSCIREDTNSYLENTSNFTKSIDGEYTVYTKV